MIELVYKAGAGETELAILRRFSRPDVVSHPDNHVIALLDELSIFDMTFAVLPLLENDLIDPWYHTLSEALDAVGQTFKASLFVLFKLASISYPLGFAGPCFHPLALRGTPRHWIRRYTHQFWRPSRSVRMVYGLERTNGFPL